MHGLGLERAYQQESSVETTCLVERWETTTNRIGKVYMNGTTYIYSRSVWSGHVIQIVRCNFDRRNTWCRRKD